MTTARDICNMLDIDFSMMFYHCTNSIYKVRSYSYKLSFDMLLKGTY